MKKVNKYDAIASEVKPENVSYTSRNIKRMYKKPPFYYFLPFAGLYIYMKDSMNYAEEAGLMDTSTPGGKYMDKFTIRYFSILNVLIPIVFFLASILFNFTFFIWMYGAKKAIKLNENALLYKDFGAL